MKTTSPVWWNRHRPWVLLALVAIFPFNLCGQSTLTIADLALELVPIPAGKFTMGSPDSEAGRKFDEGPQTVVTLSKGFWLGKTEVTQGQWLAVMGSSIADQHTKSGSENPLADGEGPQYPMYYVTYEESLAFCQALTEREKAAGRLPAGYAYTLPTEAQWEYACRAGTSGPFAAPDLDTLAWHMNNAEETSHPVATKKANPWGLHDMHGNVMERCLDWYSAKLSGSPLSDPSGPASGIGRVARGGAWDWAAANLRSASRRAIGPGTRSSRLGFRIALSPVR
jgi:formylglycine-generating enzyme required for sulfatase activity